MRRTEAPRRERAGRDGGASSRRVTEVFGIVTLAATVLLGPSLVSVQTGDGMLMGPFGHAVGRALNWALGFTGYLAVLALLAASIRIFAEGLGISSAKPRSAWCERFGTVILVFFAAVVLHLATRPYRVAGASAGGLLGELGAELFCSVVSTAGTWVLSIAGLALALVLVTNLSWARAGVAAFRLCVRGGRALGAAGARSRRHLTTAGAEMLQLLRRRELSVEPGGTASLPPPVIRLDLGLEEPEDPEAAAEAERGRATEEELPRSLEIGVEAQEPLTAAELDDTELSEAGDASDEAVEAASEGEASRSAEAGESDATGDESSADRSTSEAETEVYSACFIPGADEDEGAEVEPEQVMEVLAAEGAGVETSTDAQAQVPGTLTIVEPVFKEQVELPQVDELVSEKKVEQGDGPGFVLNEATYRPPPLSLLEYEHTEESRVDREAIYRQAERLVKTLEDYKIIGQVTEVHPGPVVTMYEFVPAPGTRISKIANLANDLAMSLAAQRVRIVAPIPGKGAVGIEVPNEKRETVYFKEIVAHDSFRKSGSALALAMGKNIVGAPVTMDLAKMPHLLVAGATGAGKSVSINAMICSLLLKCTPEEVRLIMVDPKYLELSGYNDIPHLMLPVVTDPKKANIALRWAVNEMERRYQLLADMRVRDIASYNKKVEKLRGERSDDDDDAVLTSARGAGVTAGAESRAEPEVDAAGAVRAALSSSAQPLQEAAPAKVLVVRRNADGTEEPVTPPVLGADADGPDALEAVPGAGEESATVVSGLTGGDRMVGFESSEAAGGTEGGSRSRRRQEKLPGRLPYIVVVIDEFADLMMVASKDVETSVARLAQKARAAGIHVILATQRPSVDVITGLIKANFPSRVSFQVASCHDSKTILGTQGAENLLGSGDMLVLDRGAEMKRLHGAYISDREIRRIVEWLKDQGRPVYDMDILKPTEEDEGEPEAEEQVDEMYDQAVALVAETHMASISMIQRRLRVGYNRAARMVERMEREGIVSPPDGVKGREVLIQHHQG